MGHLYNVRKPPHSKTFGMEIECYQHRRQPTGPWYSGNHVGFWVTTEDVSLSYSGLEWVCQPMPYNMLVKQINKLYVKLQGWSVDERCGLHIHVSRQYWSDKRESAFSEFLSTLTSYQTVELFGRDSEHYAKRKQVSRTEKYRAVNVLHADTYEFRLWKAGNAAWCIEALRRTKLIVEHRGNWSYDTILNLFTKV